MRSSNEIIKEIKELEFLINEGFVLQKKYHDDFALELTINQNSNRRNYLLKELSESIIAENKHSIKFAIKNVDKKVPILLDRFVESVQTFQNILQQTCRTYFHQKKESMELMFLTTYPSSFGVQLSTAQQDLQLISESFQTMEKTFSIINNLNDDDKIIGVIKDDLKNKQLLNKYKHFYQTQAKYDNDIEIEWGDTTDDYHFIRIAKERMSKISNTLGLFENMPPREQTIKCIIEGISLGRKKIEIKFENQTIYASAEENDIYKASKLLGQFINIVVIINERINDKTEQVESSWIVKSIL